MVGAEELVVCVNVFAPCPSAPSSRCTRTWALIGGMSGLIVLFWFVEGGIALRYFVGLFRLFARIRSPCPLDPVYRCHVGSIRSLGCNW